MKAALLGGLVVCLAALFNAEFLLVETADDQDENMVGKGEDFAERGK